jgi:hypothetical protein
VHGVLVSRPCPDEAQVFTGLDEKALTVFDFEP